MKPKASPAGQHLKSFYKINRLQTFKALKRLEFSGELIWSSSEGAQWVIVLSFGELLYATDGGDSKRRWQRCLPPRFTNLAYELQSLRNEASESSEAFSKAYCELELLSDWISQRKITIEAYYEFANHLAEEILFDVVQAADVTYELHRRQNFTRAIAIPPIDENGLIGTVRDLWWAWTEAGLDRYSPAQAPLIKNPELMRSAISPHAYQGLTLLLDGYHSLRDLAAKTQRPMVQFAQALKPYLDAGWLELIEVLETSQSPILSHGQTMAQTSKLPLIACVDDSLMICQSMGQVVRAAGYDFISITEASRAINMLLTRRPSLVFLDLVMPDTNGYEICSQMRRVSFFKETPIIILSGNDGLVDQVRAKLLGATDFLSKPMEPIVILSIIQKHLGSLVVASG